MSPVKVSALVGWLQNSGRVLVQVARKPGLSAKPRRAFTSRPFWACCQGNAATVYAAGVEALGASAGGICLGGTGAAGWLSAGLRVRLRMHRNVPGPAASGADAQRARVDHRSGGSRLCHDFLVARDRRPLGPVGTAGFDDRLLDQLAQRLDQSGHRPGHLAEEVLPPVQTSRRGRPAPIAASARVFQTAPDGGGLLPSARTAEQGCKLGSCAIG